MKGGLLSAAAAAFFLHTLVGEARLTDDKSLSPFTLLPAAPCDTAPDIRQCLVAQPKDWAADERTVLAATMSRLVEHDLVRGLLIGARDKGYAGLRRYATDTKLDATQGRVPKFSPGFVHFPSKTIGVTDAFFRTAEVIDPRGAYRLGDLTLLHELVHAYDDRTESLDARFTRLMGWEQRNGRWTYTKPVRMTEYLGVVADTMTAYGRGRYDSAWTRDRSFATTMAFPVPTIQSIVAPGESYADILAHLILDPTASSYLDRDLVQWFHAAVFPALREKARRFQSETLEIF
jgi:hypothetical protein